MFTFKSEFDFASIEPIILNGAGLTKRQTEVVVCVAAGGSDKAIADQLGGNKNTIHVHLNNVYGATGLRSKFEVAAAMAREHPELSPVQGEGMRDARERFFDSLTDTERDVLDELSTGKKTQRQVADALGIALSTVRGHLWRARTKTGLKNCRQLIHIFNLPVSHFTEVPEAVPEPLVLETIEEVSPAA